MKIIHDSWIGEEAIKRMEQHYNAKYICDTALKGGDGNYVDSPFAIFYANEKHPEGSNWFALYLDYIGRTMITNAIEVEGRIINGLMVDDKIVYSSYRHDMQCLTDSSGSRCCIDGGVDYLKVLGTCPIVKLK
jgi:hypothetical protein